MSSCCSPAPRPASTSVHRAVDAFNTGFDRAQFDRARRDFPALTFPPAPCTTGSTPCAVVPVTPVDAQALAKTEPVSIQVKATGSDLRYSATGLPPRPHAERHQRAHLSGKPTAGKSGYVQVTVTGRDANAGQTSFGWKVVDWVGQLRDTSGGVRRQHLQRHHGRQSAAGMGLQRQQGPILHGRRRSDQRAGSVHRPGTGGPRVPPCPSSSPAATPPPTSNG